MALVDPGCVSLALISNLGDLEKKLGKQAFAQLKKMLDNSGRLQAPEFRRWFQSVVDKALRSYKPLPSVDGTEVKLKVSESVLAKTLHITVANKDQIDIDLVPVFELDYTQLPEGFQLPDWAHNYRSEADKWVMVPKGHKGSHHSWRMHFPAIENKLIEDAGGCVKPVIRLVKALKEKNNWRLSSYAIKNVVMRHLLASSRQLASRHLVAQPTRSEWDHQHEFTRLLEVLERMRAEVLNRGPGIHWLFDERVNLIPAGMDQSTRESIAGFLQSTVDRLKKFPETIPEIFLPRIPEEKTHDLSTSRFSPICDLTSDGVGVGRPVKNDHSGLKRTFKNSTPGSFPGDDVEAPPCKRRAFSDITSSLNGTAKGTGKEAKSAESGAGEADAATPSSASVDPAPLRPASQCGQEDVDRSCDQSETGEVTFEGQGTRNAPPSPSLPIGSSTVSDNTPRVEQETQQRVITTDLEVVHSADICPECSDVFAHTMRVMSHFQSIRDDLR